MAKPRSKAKDILTYLALRVAAAVLHMLPVRWSYAAAACIGNLMYRLDKRHRDRAIAHLRTSFPDWPEQKLHETCRESMRNMVYLGVEVLFTTRLVTPQRWHRYVRLANMAETARIYDSDQTGPIGYLAVARLAAEVDPRIARLFASKGLERLSADDFRKDFAVLWPEEGPLAEILTSLSGALRGLDDQEVETLGSPLGAAHQGFLKNWVKELRKAPGRPAREVLGGLLERYWNEVFRPEVEARLKVLTQEGEVEVL